MFVETCISRHKICVAFYTVSWAQIYFIYIKIKLLGRKGALQTKDLPIHRCEV